MLPSLFLAVITPQMDDPPQCQERQEHHTHAAPEPSDGVHAHPYVLRIKHDTRRRGEHQFDGEQTVRASSRINEELTLSACCELHVNHVGG